MEGYKTLEQISKECGINKGVCYRISVKEEIKPHKFIFNNKNFYDSSQEDIIHRTLYFEGRIDHLIIPSKLNTM